MQEQDKMTKERLASYISLKMEVDNQLERLTRMRNEEKIPAMRESDGSQHSPGTGDRMERAIIRRMEYENRVMPQIEAALAEMETIEQAIYAVSDPMEREVLRLRYMEGNYIRHLPWRDVALKLFGDDDKRHMVATYRLHAQALNNITS
jgi:hypothetical protein